MKTHGAESAPKTSLLKTIFKFQNIKKQKGDHPMTKKCHKKKRLSSKRTPKTPIVLIQNF